MRAAHAVPYLSPFCLELDCSCQSYRLRHIHSEGCISFVHICCHHGSNKNELAPGNGLSFPIQVVVSEATHCTCIACEVGTSPARSRASSLERSRREQGPGRPRPASHSPVPPRPMRTHTGNVQGLSLLVVSNTCQMLMLLQFFLTNIFWQRHEQLSGHACMHHAGQTLHEGS